MKLDLAHVMDMDLILRVHAAKIEIGLNVLVTPMWFTHASTGVHPRFGWPVADHVGHLRSITGSGRGIGC